MLMKKNLDLLHYIMEIFSSPYLMVMDPQFGSAATILACFDSNLVSISVEHETQ